MFLRLCVCFSRECTCAVAEIGVNRSERRFLETPGNGRRPPTGRENGEGRVTRISLWKADDKSLWRGCRSENFASPEVTAGNARSLIARRPRFLSRRFVHSFYSSRANPHPFFHCLPLSLALRFYETPEEIAFLLVHISFIFVPAKISCVGIVVCIIPFSKNTMSLYPATFDVPFILSFSLVHTYTDKFVRTHVHSCTTSKFP